MSDALTYLMKIRGDAMRSYFDFIKKSGGSLDPKTRAIISVITKVENQTETGFKQYLSRALQAGVTPDEILDALFVAFPTLGLSKIIWAVELILAMDIPEFRPEQLARAATWHELGLLDDFKQGTTAIQIDGMDLFIHRNEDAVKVYDSHCPHQVTKISSDNLSGNVLTCPKHNWKFDIRNGECIEIGNRPLKKIESRIENGQLLALW